MLRPARSGRGWAVGALAGLVRSEELGFWAAPALLPSHRPPPEHLRAGKWAALEQRGLERRRPGEGPGGQAVHSGWDGRAEPVCRREGWPGPGGVPVGSFFCDEGVAAWNLSPG